MDSRNPEDTEERVVAETPEDVAVLYTWANLQGAKYRDFSASRREFRAQMRKRAAETQREAELRAKAEAEAAAAAAERAAREADEAARFHESEARRAAEDQRQHDLEMEQQARARAMQHAVELSRRAASERMEAARRAEAVAAAEAAAQREAHEVTEARASAERQAARYAESESIRKALTGPQPAAVVPGVITDPYTNQEPVLPPERTYTPPAVLDSDMRASRLPSTREEKFSVPAPEDSAVIRADRTYYETMRTQPEVPGTQRALEEIPAGPVNYYYEPDSQERVAAVDQYAQYARYKEETPVPAHPVVEEVYQVPVEEDVVPGFKRQGFQPDESSATIRAHREALEHAAPPSSVPAWLNAPEELAFAPIETRPRPVPPPVADTLQRSRERVAARWQALKGIMEQGTPGPQSGTPLARHHDSRTPLVAIFSISGGVGKTSTAATLGRALSAMGERVLLADTTQHGLLPFYFGASELHPGVVRTFSPPEGSSSMPIALVGLDVSSKSGDAASEEWLAEGLARDGHDAQRIVLDLSSAFPWVVRRLARLNTVVLVPVAPDMNSVISLGAIERFFAGIHDAEGRSVAPFYLLNGFDTSLPLHLDVREVMKRQLGERLLPFVIRRSPSISEALAEGMTVMDYAPESAVAGDYMNLASWLRAQSAPVESGVKHTRWGER